MAAVATHEIRKKFGDVGAVDGISLEARDGEFMVLLGPSGCGKTTLLRIIAGLEKPTSGQVLIDGQVVNDIPPRGRGIAMVFQSYGLYPHLTVWNNIAFPLRTQGTARPEIKRKVEWAAGLLGIDHIAVIDHGKLRQVGTPTEIYEHPADEFVASFLGTPPMNLIEREGGSMGFRPENFLPKELLNGTAVVEFPFRVDRVEYLGSEHILYGALDGRAAKREVTAKLPAHATLNGISPGAWHAFAVRETELRYFDRDGRNTQRPLTRRYLP